MNRNNQCLRKNNEKYIWKNLIYRKNQCPHWGNFVNFFDLKRIKRN